MSDAAKRLTTYAMLGATLTPRCVCGHAEAYHPNGERCRGGFVNVADGCRCAAFHEAVS